MYLNESNGAELARRIAEHRPGPRETVLILLAENQAQEVPELIDTLGRLDIRFFGGLFPALVSGTTTPTEGAIVTVLPTLGPPLVVRGLEGRNISLPALPQPRGSSPNGTPPSAVVLVDCLARNLSEFLASLYAVTGDRYHILGGGAGRSTLTQEPVVFTKDGLFQDAAVLAVLDCPSEVSAHHGWQRISDTLVATRTRGNVIVELNWENAFHTYRGLLDNPDVNPENFFHVVKGRPLGMHREGGEEIIRDPIFLGPGGEIQCLSEVPENSVLYLMEGDSGSLIDAARRVAKDCTAQHPDRVRRSLVIDCYSRMLFLEDEFPSELAALEQGLSEAGVSCALEGAVTLGEIASRGQEVLEFLNKTVALGLFHG